MDIHLYTTEMIKLLYWNSSPPCTIKQLSLQSSTCTLACGTYSSLYWKFEFIRQLWVPAV